MPRQQTFERGDKIYMVSPVQVFKPTDAQIEEYAFATQVKKGAPNENLVWFRGQYVEADHPNRNGAQWKADELAVKSLTPMLMPVTVMHDPRTAVGTIADVKLLTPEKDGVQRARIDTVLALWGHRFPDAVNEAEENAQQGTLMQSMECYSPWYECSECGMVFHKLPMGAEKAMWCEHLATSNPSAGYVAQESNASRILGDVTFTGTGLIYGSRGARGAYSEAHLENFQDELASYHEIVHTSTATDTPRSTTRMGLVQIEDTELAQIRKERDDAKAEAAKVTTLAQEKAEAIAAAEKAEADKAKAEQERDAAKAEATAAAEERAKVETKDRRWGALGDQFVASLGDFTKSRLQEQAASMSDEDWDGRLKEIEETANVKRDAKKEGASTETASSRTLLDPPDFKAEEVASLTPGDRSTTATIDRTEQAQVVGKLGGLFKKS